MLQFDTASHFYTKIHINFYCQYAKFRNVAFEKVHLDFLKIKVKAHSQFSKKFVDKFCSPPFCAFNHLIWLFWVAKKMLAHALFTYEDAKRKKYFVTLILLTFC